MKKNKEERETGREEEEMEKKEIKNENVEKTRRKNGRGERRKERKTGIRIKKEAKRGNEARRQKETEGKRKQTVSKAKVNQQAPPPPASPRLACPPAMHHQAFSFPVPKASVYKLKLLNLAQKFNSVRV